MFPFPNFEWAMSSVSRMVGCPDLLGSVMSVRGMLMRYVDAGVRG